MRITTEQYEGLKSKGVLNETDIQEWEATGSLNDNVLRERIDTYKRGQTQKPTQEPVQEPVQEFKQEPIKAPVSNNSPVEDVSVAETPKTSPTDSEWASIPTPEDVNGFEQGNLSKLKQLTGEELNYEEFLEESREKGLTDKRAITKLKGELVRRGYNVSDFDSLYGEQIEESASLNQSGDDYFDMLMNGEKPENTKWLEQNSYEYQSAQKRASKFNAFDKSEAGIKRAIFNGTLNEDMALWKDLNDAGYGQILDQQQQNLIQHNADLEAKGLSGEISTKPIAEWDMNDLTNAVKKMFGETHGSYMSDYIKDWEENSTLSQNRDRFTKVNENIKRLSLERESLYDTLRAKYPNKSEAFISAMYNRQNSALETQLRQYTAEASAYETGIKTELNVLNSKYAVRQDIENKRLNNFNQMMNLVTQEKEDANKLTYLKTQYQNSEDLARANHKRTLEVNQATFKNDMLLQQAELNGGVDLSKEQETEANKSLVKVTGLDLNADQIKSYTKTIRGLAGAGYNSSEIDSMISANMSSHNIGTGGNLGGVFTEAINNMGGTEKESELNQKRLSYVINQYGADSTNVRDFFTSYVGTHSDLTAPERRTFNETLINVDALEDVKKEIDKLSDDDWQKLVSLQKKGWNLFGEAGDEEMKKKWKIEGKIAPILMTFRKSMTGVAFSEKEARDYRKLFAQAGDSKELATIKTDIMIDSFYKKIDGNMSSVMGPTAYEEIFKNRGANIKSGREETEERKYVGGDRQIKTIGNNPPIDVNYLRNVPSGTVVPTRLNETSQWNTVNGKECGEYINDIYNLGVGSSLDSKLDKMDLKFNPLLGLKINAGKDDVVVWNPGRSSYGHIGYVVDKKDGKVLVRSSNLSPGTITEDWVSESELLGVKYMDAPEMIKKTAETTEEEKGYFGTIKEGIDEKGAAGWTLEQGWDSLKGGGGALWNTITGGVKKVDDALSYGMSQTLNGIVSIIGKATGQEYNEKTNAELYAKYAGGSRNKAEAFFDITTGTLDVGATTNIGGAGAIAILGALSGNDITGPAIEKFGEGVGSIGEFVNKFPKLAQFREALPEDRREEFDMYVGGLTIAAGVKGIKLGKNLGKKGSTKFKETFGKKFTKPELIESQFNVPDSFRTTLDVDGTTSLSKATSGIDDALKNVDDASLNSLDDLVSTNDINIKANEYFRQNIFDKHSSVKLKTDDIKTMARDLTDVYKNGSSKQKAYAKEITKKLTKEGLNLEEVNKLQTEFNKASRVFEGNSKTTAKDIYKGVQKDLNKIDPEITKINKKISDGIAAKELIEGNLKLGKKEVNVARQEALTTPIWERPLKEIAKIVGFGKTGPVAVMFRGINDALKSGKITVSKLEKNILPKIAKEYKISGGTKSSLLEILSKEINTKDMIPLAIAIEKEYEE